MRRVRDVFYINANYEENYFTYYGMEFSEFIKYRPVPIANILMLSPWLLESKDNNNWCMGTFNEAEEIAKLCKHDIYHFGDFHWLDYRDEESLARSTEQEKAEVLYLSHFMKPLHTPFFDSIGNNYVYLAHDDGWRCQLYCKDMTTFGDIIANKIMAFFSTNKRRKIYPIGDDIKNQLLEWSKDGLLIDFSHATISGQHCSLSFDMIGKFDDMDDMYHDLNRRKEFASKQGWLEQKDKTWKLDFWERRKAQE
jgi:hypothetical protein